MLKCIKSKYTLAVRTLPSLLLLVALVVIIGCSSDEPRIYLPTPSFHEAAIRIDNQVCADRSPFLGLVLVLSHPANTDKRQMIRTTYPAREISELGFRRLFVVGTMNDGVETHWTYVNLTRSDDEIADESQEFGDMMQLNHTDLYYDLILKAYATYQWTAANCGQARFIVKADDDMFIDYYQLAKTLRDVDDADVDAIHGHLIRDTWNLTPYMAGGCYVTSPRTLGALVEAGRTMQPFMHLAEDVFFTGLVADRLAVERVDLEEVRAWVGAPQCCVDDGGRRYRCQFSVFTQRPKLLPLKKLLKFKRHGKGCYYYYCESYSDRLLSDKRVNCFSS